MNIKDLDENLEYIKNAILNDLKNNYKRCNFYIESIEEHKPVDSDIYYNVKLLIRTILNEYNIEVSSKYLYNIEDYIKFVRLKVYDVLYKSYFEDIIGM